MYKSGRWRKDLFHFEPERKHWVVISYTNGEVQLHTALGATNLYRVVNDSQLVAVQQQTGSNECEAMQMPIMRNDLQFLEVNTMRNRLSR